MNISQTTSIGIPSGLFLGGLLAWGASWPSHSTVFQFSQHVAGTRIAAAPANGRTMAPSQGEESDADRVLAKKVELLKTGRAFLASVPCYTAQINSAKS